MEPAECSEHKAVFSVKMKESFNSIFFWTLLTLNRIIFEDMVTIEAKDVKIA